MNRFYILAILWAVLIGINVYSYIVNSHPISLVSYVCVGVIAIISNIALGAYENIANRNSKE